MMTKKPRRNYRPSRRRALELLASSRDGYTEAILRAHGLSAEQMIRLVQAGLATAHSQRVVAGKRVIEITRMRITEAGWKALAEKPTEMSAAPGTWTRIT